MREEHWTKATTILAFTARLLFYMAASGTLDGGVVQ